jgi:hypothetical protein
LEGLQVRAGPVAEHLAGQDRAEVEAYRGRVDERHTPVELGGSLSEPAESQRSVSDRLGKGREGRTRGGGDGVAGAEDEGREGKGRGEHG